MRAPVAASGGNTSDPERLRGWQLEAAWFYARFRDEAPVAREWFRRAMETHNGMQGSGA